VVITSPPEPPGPPINLQAANTAVTYPALAVTADISAVGPATMSQGFTLSVKTDANGNLKELVLFPGGWLDDYTGVTPGSLPSLNSPITIDAASGVINGNGYAAALSGGALTGTLNGNFYGPGARETAGVWQASGAGQVWVGSFGAKQ
jgi:hypothetical protein